MPTPSRNPVYLYDDVVVGIIPQGHLNNGHPSLHAVLIASAAPEVGEPAVHLGDGLGYYTAILHRLIGRRGSGMAIEFDTGTGIGALPANGRGSAFAAAARSDVRRGFCRARSALGGASRGALSRDCARAPAGRESDREI